MSGTKLPLPSRFRGIVLALWCSLRLCPSTVEQETAAEEQKAAPSRFDVDQDHPIELIGANHDMVILPFRTYLNHASSVRLKLCSCRIVTWRS